MRDTAPAERARQYSALLRTLATGGAAVASLTSPGVLLGVGPVGTVTTDCGECSEGGLPIKWKVKAATHRFVSADTFQMLGVNLVEGRAITAEDGWDSRRVAVINRSLAAREFQNGQPIGRGIRVVDDGDRWSTVVGVVDDPPSVGVGASVQPRYTVYLSVLQHPPAAADLFTNRNRPAVLKAAHGALVPGALDPAATTLGAILDGQATLLGWFAAQLGLQGWAMLGIAALGSLAVARLWVSSLLVELGVRRALGARRRQTVSYVLLRASAVCAVGIAGGIWFGASIWSILGDLVPGLDPWDAGLVLRYGSILLLSVLLGALPPAWRASRRTPASLLASS